MNSNLGMNQHNVPMAQYGHYWSSVGGLLTEDETSDTDGSLYQNGDSLKHSIRKVSNIPLGDNSQVENDEPDQKKMSPLALSTDQNGHSFNLGTTGVRDVRIKKTMFKNLSPYRK